MASSVYFLDASALVHYYAPLDEIPGSRLIRSRIAQLIDAVAASRGRMILQIPNICMAECAGAFARICFETNRFGAGEAADDAFRQMRTTLLNDVQRDRLIHSYELKRAHFEGIEDIFRRDYALSAPRRGGRLSANDALILSMANEYRTTHRGSSVRIVTNDRRISDFCRASTAEFTAAVHISTQSPI